MKIYPHKAVAEYAGELAPAIHVVLSMNPWDVIQELYASEINAGLETDWDRGMHVWIAAGGRRLAKHSFLPHEFNEVGPWLDREARLLFPRSQYAAVHLR